MRKRSGINLISIGTVTVCPNDQDRKETYIIPAPLGKNGTSLAFKLMNIISEFQDAQTRADETDSAIEKVKIVMDAIERVAGQDEWWNNTMPMTFGVHSDAEEKKHLQDDFTAMELFNPFIEAAGMITARAFGSEESTAALKKSNEGEDEPV